MVPDCFEAALPFCGHACQAVSGHLPYWIEIVGQFMCIGRYKLKNVLVIMPDETPQQHIETVWTFEGLFWSYKL